MHTKLAGCLVFCVVIVAGCQQASDNDASPPREAQPTLAMPTTTADCERLLETLLNHPVCVASDGQAHQQGAHRMHNFDKMQLTHPRGAPPALGFDAPPVSPQVP